MNNIHDYIKYMVQNAKPGTYLFIINIYLDNIALFYLCHISQMVHMSLQFHIFHQLERRLVLFKMRDCFVRKFKPDLPVCLQEMQINSVNIILN